MKESGAARRLCGASALSRLGPGRGGARSGLGWALWWGRILLESTPQEHLLRRRLLGDDSTQHLLRLGELVRAGERVRVRRRDLGFLRLALVRLGEQAHRFVGPVECDVEQVAEVVRIPRVLRGEGDGAAVRSDGVAV